MHQKYAVHISKVCKHTHTQRVHPLYLASLYHSLLHSHSLPHLSDFPAQGNHLGWKAPLVVELKTPGWPAVSGRLSQVILLTSTSYLKYRLRLQKQMTSWGYFCELNIHLRENTAVVQFFQWNNRKLKSLLLITFQVKSIWWHSIKQ